MSFQPLFSVSPDIFRRFFTVSCHFSLCFLILRSISVDIPHMPVFQPLFPVLRSILAVFSRFFPVNFSLCFLFLLSFSEGFSCHFSLCFLISCFSTVFPRFPVDFSLCFLLLFSAFFPVYAIHTCRNLTRTNIDSWSRDAHGLYIHQVWKPIFLCILTPPFYTNIQQDHRLEHC